MELEQQADGPDEEDEADSEDKKSQEKPKAQDKFEDKMLKKSLDPKQAKEAENKSKDVKET